VSLATWSVSIIVTRKGKECYDAVVNRNGKEMAIRVDTNGKFIGTHPEKNQQKEKAEKY